MAGHMYNGRETELLIPASSLEVLKIAVIFGADAVYIGGEAFGLRAKAKNFSIEDMKEGVKFAHERNVKVYVTANILAHNYDLEGARAYFEELKEVGPDALIILIRAHTYHSRKWQISTRQIWTKKWNKKRRDGHTTSVK